MKMFFSLFFDKHFSCVQFFVCICYNLIFFNGLVFHLQFKLYQSALIASGQIEQCINEDDIVENYDCSPKMVVTLTLTEGQGEVESLQANLYQVFDTDGTSRELEYPVLITLSIKQ